MRDRIDASVFADDVFDSPDADVRDVPVAPYTTFALACRDVVAALGIDAGIHSMFCTRDEAESVANGISAALGTLPVWWEQPTCRGWRWVGHDGAPILTLHVRG